ncbi:parallel beta-helix domain-containing protein [Marinobacter sp. M216]|uniref:mannuronan 5-epimerase n=1 Tax=Marinobacter albus TaxID=3030833 RepID=A0ABT7HEC9_9GAMM|nr:MULTISPECIES: parallel beta-helix domain-containing protein [unclassified Marinobacter]MBW7472149.1 right-handed parallel beta-helix repeat-containing protein [Marinobacter sp. F4218]MDK9558719.1 parallel beta-helix domain-containing protein [Marinobacter sp. M216]
MWTLPGRKGLLSVAVLSGSLFISGCGDDGKDGAPGPAGSDGSNASAQSTTTTTSGFAIPGDAIFVAADAQPGDDITEALLLALFNVPDDATVVLPKGRFTVSETITINSASGLILTGHGINETILDFSNADGDDAIRFEGGTDITIRDLGVYEARKNGIKTISANGVHMTYTATVWEGELASDNGAYGLYPLQSQNVLLENNYAYGSADAGIYVGQSNNIVIRDNSAINNVAGIEIENSTMADVYNNLAAGNTGGILAFDLPGLEQAYGGNIRIFNNTVYANNAENVGSGAVGIVPPGTGVLVYATSDVEIYNNQITDNETTAIAIASYFLADDDVANYPANYGATMTRGWSPLVKNVYMHNNTIARNGADPRGALIQDIVDGYTLMLGETMPAILYGGIGELLSNAGAIAGFDGLVGPEAAADGVDYDAYASGDLICANSNVNGNPAPDYENVNTGLVYDPTGATTSYVDGAPQPSLLIDQMVNNTYLACVQNRLPPASVNFKNNIYGCAGDDLAEHACSL